MDPQTVTNNTATALTTNTFEIDGYTFTGWYDEDGNRVDYVTYFQFFNEIETEWGIDYDWQNPNTVILTAGWEPDT